MKKWILLMAVAGVFLGAVAGLLMTGPRMRNQPNIRAYQTHVPLPPAGVVPVEPIAAPRAASMNPLVSGKVYYQYYCQMCHGASGDGNGPVGQSFVPVPADLRTAKVQALPDAQLLRAMLTGSGHEPAAWPALSRVEGNAARPAVLEYTVLPEHRESLVLYVRSLGAAGRPATAPAPNPAQ